jgi:hypothetical protein
MVVVGKGWPKRGEDYHELTLIDTNELQGRCSRGGGAEKAEKEKGETRGRGRARARARARGSCRTHGLNSPFQVYTQEES